jgi:hypothetical protein
MARVAQGIINGKVGGNRRMRTATLEGCRHPPKMLDLGLRVWGEGLRAEGCGIAAGSRRTLGRVQGRV